jgi:hypothetical protein
MTAGGATTRGRVENPPSGTVNRREPVPVAGRGLMGSRASGIVNRCETDRGGPGRAE